MLTSNQVKNAIIVAGIAVLFYFLLDNFFETCMVCTIAYAIYQCICYIHRQYAEKQKDKHVLAEVQYSDPPVNDSDFVEESEVPYQKPLIREASTSDQYEFDRKPTTRMRSLQNVESLKKGSVWTKKKEEDIIQEGTNEKKTKTVIYERVKYKAPCLKENECVEESFLKRLNLSQFYPKKLQLTNVMELEESSSSLEMSKIALNVAMKIIMINYTARDEFLLQLTERIQDRNDTPYQGSLLKNLVGAKEFYNDNSRSIHPLDLILAIFKCSSPMLQQVLALKLFSCKLAIPFVHPPFENESYLLTLWPLRSILIECKNEKGSLDYVSIDCPCHVVSFFRLGRPSVSKSKLMNEIISDQYHNTFFNKDCPLGTTSREVSEGMIEAGWYLPSYNAQHFNTVTMFLNLRGDGTKFKSSCLNLSRISNIVVVLINIDELDDDQCNNFIRLLSSSQPNICLAVDAGMYKQQEIMRKIEFYNRRIEDLKPQPKLIIVAMNGQMRSISTVKTNLRKTISEEANDSKLKNMTLSERLKDYEGNVDEQNEIYTTAKCAAHKIINQMISPNVKKEVVPLQGKTWQTWSEKMKRSNKASQYKTLQEQGKLQSEMLDERRKQAKMCRKLSPSMAMFLKYLKHLVSSDDECLVFVLYLKQMLDERSRNILPKYLSDLNICWQNLKASRDNNDQPDVTRTFSEKFNNSKQRLMEVSFGLEHFCREMGQMYECLNECPPLEKDLLQLKECLPNMTARLLLMGLPFEIMDEDVANVPLHWVTAVLKTLKGIIGDKKLLTLSVLGIQSSGKSTLLNTMFGLQFAVSAGRCTRGVFMQLVPVKKRNSPFDYLMIIDTEGLRSPEQAYQKHSHDNELATFVTGLADITIVNIKGENTAEIKDILQIVVHASLRLKLANERLNLSQSCLFVHQNVPAIDANDKMIQGRQNFVEELDTMTKEAANQENIADIQSFNQVIKFDSESDVWYFSDLWGGDPPMAPANPGYSDNVSKVKNMIVDTIAMSRSTYLTITDTISRISDLSNGIVQDDFVFSFRNSLEVKAYSSLEQKCQELSWKLEKQVLEFEQTKARSSLVLDKGQMELETRVSHHLTDLRNKVNQQVQNQIQELEAFIDQNSLKEVMIQWTQSKTLRFKTNAEILMMNAQKHINNIKDEILVKCKTTEEKTKHEMEINDLARTLAIQMKGQIPDEEVLRKIFNERWNSWINRIPLAEENDVPVHTQIESLLCEQFQFDAAFILRQKPLPDQCYQNLKTLEYSLNQTNISKGHISTKNLLSEKMEKDEKTDVFVRQTIDVINIIFRQIDNILAGLSVQDISFDITYVKHILTVAVTGIGDHNKHENNQYQFSLSSLFRAMIINHVASYATVFFTRKKEEYSNKHSPKAQIEEYKGTAWILFQSTVQEKTDDVIAVGLFKEVILKAIVEQIDNLLPIDVSDHIIVQFGDGKHGLLSEILLELANDENFDNYFAFIKDPKCYVENWLRKLIQKKVFDTTINNKKMIALLVQKRSLKLFELIHRSIDSASKRLCANISDWLERFASEVNTTGTLALPEGLFVHVQKTPVKDIRAFVDLLNQEMVDIREKILDSYNKITSTTVIWKDNPMPRIMKKLWGCTAICMFCHEPCKEMSPDHWERDNQPHTCVQHRPDGLNGFRYIRTSKMSVDFCNFSVGSDLTYTIGEKHGPYKKYKNHFPSWDIKPNANASDYWKWVTCTFKENLMRTYDIEAPDIPENWRSITKQKAIDSLSTSS